MGRGLENCEYEEDTEMTNLKSHTGHKCEREAIHEGSMKKHKMKKQEPQDTYLLEMRPELLNCK